MFGNFYRVSYYINNGKSMEYSALDKLIIADTKYDALNWALHHMKDEINDVSEEYRAEISDNCILIIDRETNQVVRKLCNFEIKQR